LGTQFRRCATVGASVYSKYGFSDILPGLLVLDSEVELIKNGRMPLREFLEKPIARDVLTCVYIRKDERRASYQCLRNASADFPILNAAVSKHGSQWTVAVGARPARAQIASEASKKLSGMADVDLDAVAAATEQELSFSTNNKASEEYRRAMCRVLVKRAIGEVLSCK
jgi:CO/xanthine dehydrogenase FAD-binding subunit